MTALTWLNGLNSEAFTAVGQKVIWSDMIGNLIGLTALALGWLLVDVVGVPLAFSSGLAFSGLVYVVYLVLVLWGLRDWWLRSRMSTRPVLEGALVSDARAAAGPQTAAIGAPLRRMGGEANNGGGA